MNIIGNVRGSGGELAAHLQKHENEHIEIFELRGFMADDLEGAFAEARAMSNATKCQKYLFSLSVNPPPGEEVATPDFLEAIDQAEKRLGLLGQPRAIVFHEKLGRRHAHAVWSRIDPFLMKAVDHPFFKRRLNSLARELHLEHGWEIPKGFFNAAETDPRNFTLAEWQQAKRVNKDPRVIKQVFQEAWASSDSKATFAHALEEHGYFLARGNKRPYVAVDCHGEVYGVARQTGVKTKNVRQRLGDANALPDIDAVKARVAGELIPLMKRFKGELVRVAKAQGKEFEAARERLVEDQRRERSALKEKLALRRSNEARMRSSRLRTGFAGLWERFTGAHRRVLKRNEAELQTAQKRDRAEIDALVHQHLRQRQDLSEKRTFVRGQIKEQAHNLKREFKSLSELRAGLKPDRSNLGPHNRSRTRNRAPSRGR